MAQAASSAWCSTTKCPEMFLTELKQRIRDVRQGRDGLIYLLTEETDDAVLRLEPAD